MTFVEQLRQERAGLMEKLSGIEMKLAAVETLLNLYGDQETALEDDRKLISASNTSVKPKRTIERYSEADLNTMRRMYGEGKKYSEIAAVLGRHPISVHAKLKKMGFPTHRERTDVTVEKFDLIDVLELAWDNRLKCRGETYILDGEVISRPDLAQRTNRQLQDLCQPTFRFPDDWKAAA